MLARHFGSIYGWVVVVTIALVLSTTNGTRYSFSHIYKPLEDTLHVERASIAIAFSIAVLVRGVMQPIAGYLADNLGHKRMLLIGMTCLSIGLLATSLSTQLWQIYLFFGLFAGFGFSATSQVAASPIIANWFVKRRATALSFGSAGVAIGQLVLVPTTSLIATTVSWQASFQALAGVILLIILPTAFLLIKVSPTEIGRAPDGELVSPSKPAAPLDPKVSFRVAVRNPILWQLGFGFFVCGFTMSFPAAHLIPFAQELGLHEMEAAGALGMMGGISLAGSLAFGYFSDRIGRKNALAIAYLLRGLSFFALMLAAPGLTFYLAAVMIGITWTTTVPLTSAISADIWGRRSLGTIFGTIYVGMDVGSALGAWLDGLIFDWSGGYGPALIINAALGILAAIVIYGIRERPKEAQPATSPRPEPALAAR